MANNLAINNLLATGYNADVEATKSGFVITGKVGLDTQKNITSFSGEVKKDDAFVCRFNTFNKPIPMREQGITFNLNDIQDTELGSQALVALGEVFDEVQTEVKK